MVLKSRRLADATAGGAPLNESEDVPLSRLPLKGRLVCRGRIESVTYEPADRTAAFSAMVSDADPHESGAGTAAGPRGRLRVVWLGRRRVPGIEAGAEVRLKGMVSRVEGMPTMFNPRYEILSRQENE